MIKSPAWFDLPKACLGAVVSSAIVAWINLDYGYLPALTAAAKQALFAFFAVGLIVQFCQWLALRPVARIVAAPMAVLLPLMVTASTLYGVHSLEGTPEPFYSTIPGSLLALIGFVLVTWQTMSATGPAASGLRRARRPAPEHK